MNEYILIINKYINEIFIHRCDGEVWVGEGCHYAFICDSSEDIGGQVVYCPETQIVTVNTDVFPPSFYCVDEGTAGCPRGGILGAGCPLLECEQVSLKS